MGCAGCVGGVACHAAVHLLVGRHEESPEHATDAAAHGGVICAHELRAQPLELADDGGGHAAVEVDAHLSSKGRRVKTRGAGCALLATHTSYYSLSTFHPGQGRDFVLLTEHLPPGVDERRELSVAQHAHRVARVGAVETVGDDAHLVVSE